LSVRAEADRFVAIALADGGDPCNSNSAVTVPPAAPSITHCPRMICAQPVMPTKVDPAAAEPESVTGPEPKLAEQFPGQLMPAGSLVTVPDPVPVRLTVMVPASVRSPRTKHRTAPAIVPTILGVVIRVYQGPDIGDGSQPIKPLTRSHQRALD